MLTREEYAELNAMLDEVALEMVNGASVDIDTDHRSARISELLTRSIVEGVEGRESMALDGLRPVMH